MQRAVAWWRCLWTMVRGLHDAGRRRRARLPQLALIVFALAFRLAVSMNRHFLRKGVMRRMPGLTVLECENGREAVDAVTARLTAGLPLHFITMGA